MSTIRMSRRGALQLAGAVSGAGLLARIGAAPAQASYTWSAALQGVGSGHQPNSDFLNKMVTWASAESSWVFQPYSSNYANLFSTLVSRLGTNGTWESLEHRRAAMLEGMRVLAGYESDYDWTIGKASSGNDPDDPDTWEAGAFQESWNAHYTDVDVSGECARFASQYGITSASSFRSYTRQAAHSTFTCGFAARLLRVKISENSPLLSMDGYPVQNHVSRAAMYEFQQALASSSSSSTTPAYSPLPNLHLYDDCSAAKAIKGWLHDMYSGSSALGLACQKIDPSNGYIGADSWNAMQEFARYHDDKYPALLGSAEPLTVWGTRCWDRAVLFGFDPVARGAYN